MNVFVAGVHAVGKSYLCTDFSKNYDWMHRSASQLIREELGGDNWTADKRVSDADNNQRALVNAVKRINANGTKILLDGHFVLKGKSDEFIRLGSDIFSELSLSAVVLIEADPELIMSRLSGRDGISRGSKEIKEFLDAEREQASEVCEVLQIPLKVLKTPTPDEFARFVLAFSNLAHPQ